jgi:hypothetical protein
VHEARQMTWLHAAFAASIISSKISIETLFVICIMTTKTINLKSYIAREEN